MINEKILEEAKYFSKNELSSPDDPNSWMRITVGSLTKLSKARELAGIPFILNSAYRTKDHNKSVGGKPNSAHLLGEAFDIQAKTSQQRFQILTALISAGFKRIGVGQTFIHADDATEDKAQEVIWLYS